MLLSKTLRATVCQICLVWNLAAHEKGPNYTSKIFHFAKPRIRENRACPKILILALQTFPQFTFLINIKYKESLSFKFIQKKINCDRWFAIILIQWRRRPRSKLSIHLWRYQIIYYDWRDLAHTTCGPRTVVDIGVLWIKVCKYS